MTVPLLKWDVPERNDVAIQEGARLLCFTEPQYIFQAFTIDDVLPTLRQIESLVSKRGYYAAGFIAYEAGMALNFTTHTVPAEGLPLLWFGLYEKPIVSELPAPSVQAAYHLGAWTPSVDRQTYHKAIADIKAYIMTGDTYQVNYTFHLRAPFQGDTWSWFCDLMQAQQARYAAYLDIGQQVICSVSPELFFHLDAQALLSRPMKGTAVRGCSFIEDEKQAAWLQNSEKNRAENVMIVDMIRNDMGRVCQIGSVKTPRLFDVERYPTLWQMTSTVTGKTSASLADIFSAMFPCASITGAPKRRTMQIIKELEPEPRGLYTGTIGYFTPDRRAQFNVAIRTAVVNKARGEADYGVGSGIIWDSDAAHEYDECLLKAQVLRA